MPTDGLQRGQWDTAIHCLELINRMQALMVETSREQSLGIDL